MDFCGFWSSIRQWESWKKCIRAGYVPMDWWMPGRMEPMSNGGGWPRVPYAAAGQDLDLKLLKWLRWLRWLIIYWCLMYFVQCCFCYLKNFDMIRHFRYECLLGIHFWYARCLATDSRVIGHYPTVWPIPILIVDVESQPLRLLGFYGWIPSA